MLTATYLFGLLILLCIYGVLKFCVANDCLNLFVVLLLGSVVLIDLLVWVLSVVFVLSVLFVFACEDTFYCV